MVQGSPKEEMMDALDPNMTMLYTALVGVTAKLADEPSDDIAWTDARASLAHYSVTSEEDAELAAAIDAKDADALRAIVDGWTSGDRLMLERDRGVLKRALKAYRKSFKVTVLDAESSLGGGPMSSGRKSTIVGIMPPRRYPREVWDHLVHQGRLLGGDRGVYELPPGG